jgi:hypothetical protein
LGPCPEVAGPFTGHYICVLIVRNSYSPAPRADAQDHRRRCQIGLGPAGGRRRRFGTAVGLGIVNGFPTLDLELFVEVHEVPGEYLGGVSVELDCHFVFCSRS